MDFIKKNDFIVKQKKQEHFDADLRLFRDKCPGSPLHAELRRLNTFNKSKIHGLILMELLDKVTDVELLKNRIPVDQADTTGNPEGTGEGNPDPAATTGNPDPAATTGDPAGTGEGNPAPADKTKKGTVKKKGANKKSS